MESQRLCSVSALRRVRKGRIRATRGDTAGLWRCFSLGSQMPTEKVKQHLLAEDLKWADASKGATTAGPHLRER